MEKDYRAQNRKEPADRSPWFNNQQSINKTQKWKFGMSRFQYIPDPDLEGFGYFIWGFVGEDDRIYPIILTEDHPSDTAPRFPIVPLSANPLIKSYVNIGREQVLIPDYIKWNLASIKYQEEERGLNSDLSFKKKGTGILAYVNLKPIHKFWASHEDFTGQNVDPVRRKVFESFKNEEEYQAHLSSELAQSEVVTPDEQTVNRKRPAETPLEELDETALKKQITSTENLLPVKSETELEVKQETATVEVKQEVILPNGSEVE